MSADDAPPPPDEQQPSHRVLAQRNLVVAAKATSDGSVLPEVVALAVGIAQAEALLALDDTLQRIGKVLTSMANKR